MTGTLREERLAANEAMFRAANERRADWEEQHAESQAELYYCECADPGCHKKVKLERADYERVRADARQFFLVPGHEIPDVETVIEQGEDWAIVEKDPAVEETVKRLNPEALSSDAPA